MKKYVTPIICSVLLLVSLLVNIPQKEDVFCGRGDGKDLKVTSVEQFVEVLDFFNGEEDVESFASQDGISPYGATYNTGYSAVTPVNSATFYNKSKGKNSYKYDLNNYSNATFDRELTVYLTYNSAYYKSVGKVMQNQSVSFNGKTAMASSIMDFDVEIYIMQQACCIKFNKFDMISSNSSVSEVEDVNNSENYITSDMLGKWFNAGELGTAFLSINSENYELLGSIGEYFETNKLSHFKQSKDVYTLKSENYHNALAFIFGLGDMSEAEDAYKIKGDFIFNLSNKVKPSIILTMAFNDEETTGYMENNMTFSNINNTIIEFKPEKVYNLRDYIKDGEI